VIFINNETVNILFNKASAVEKFHPEKANQFYDEILKYENKTPKDTPKQKKFFTNVWQHKGLVLKKLGRGEEAQKCFDIVKKVVEEKAAEEMIKSMAELEKKNKEFAIIWNRIVKNQGKTMRTKRGVVFSYRVKKKSVISQYLMEYHKNDKNKGLGIISNHIDSEKFIIYAEDKAISEKLLRTATESFFDVEGPTELKRYLGINNFDSRITHLWGILNDKRILKYKKSLAN
jgi:hypothetical protein